MFENKEEQILTKDRILTMEEVDNLMYWQLDEKKSHTYRENHFFERKLTNGGFSNLMLNEQKDNEYYDMIDDDMN